MLLVQGRGEMAVMAAVTTTLLHKISLYTTVVLQSITVTHTRVTLYTTLLHQHIAVTHTQMYRFLQQYSANKLL